MGNVAPATTKQAQAFLREQASSHTDKWFRMCLKLQRTARGIPALYPTAASAQAATPANERRGLTKAVRGDIGYSKGSDPAGHIFLVDSWNVGKPRTSDNLLVWSNDMSANGRAIALVPLSRIEDRWNHKFQFVASWLNGYDFKDESAPAKAVRGNLGKNYRHAIEDQERALAYHKKKGNTALVRLLRRDLAVMKKNYEKYKKD